MRSVWLGPRAVTLPNSLSHARLLLAVGRTGASSHPGRRVRASGHRLRRRTHERLAWLEATVATAHYLDARRLVRACGVCTRMIYISSSYDIPVTPRRRDTRRPRNGRKSNPRPGPGRSASGPTRGRVRSASRARPRVRASLPLSQRLCPLIVYPPAPGAYHKFIVLIRTPLPKTIGVVRGTNYTNY